ncbi:MAG: hypothetical protein WCD60_18950, partial [Pseudolabrys sp.]
RSLKANVLTINREELPQALCGTRKFALRKLVRHGRGIQYVEHAEGHSVRMFEAVCKLGLESIVSKKLDAPYKSEPSKAW